MSIDVQQLQETITQFVPSVLASLAILVVGWLVALVGSAVVRGALRRTTLDDRIAGWVAGEEGAEAVSVERWIGRGVFWIIMLFVLVAVFEALGLTVITQPLNQFLIQLSTYAPRLVGAGALLLAAWVIASLLKVAITGVTKGANVEERLGRLAGMEEDERVPLSQTLGEAIYWLVFLLFLPAVLGALAVEGLLEPVQGMIDQILSFLPNMFAAGLLLAVGWFAARIVQRIVSNLLASLGADRLSDQVGLGQVLGEKKLSGLVGLVVYVLILVPVLIAALNALALDAITRPASDMLSAILVAVPSVLAAGLLVGIAYLVGRVVAGLITSLLTGFGFDAVLTWLGLGREPGKGERTPSEIAGYLVLVAIMLFASIEAMDLVGFEVLAALVAQFTVFGGQIVLGLIVLAIGLFLANLAARTIEASGAEQAGLLALVARGSILVLAGTMALRQTGIAQDIVNLAFAMVGGAIAVAAALAFGLGSRDVAGEEVERWVKSLRPSPRRRPRRR